MNKQSFNGKCRFYLRPEYMKNVNFQIKNNFDSFTSSRSRTNFTSYQKLCKFCQFLTALTYFTICQQFCQLLLFVNSRKLEKFQDFDYIEAVSQFGKSGHGRPMHLENKIWTRFYLLRSRVERVSLPCNLLAVIMFLFFSKLIHSLMFQLYFVIFKYVPMF